MLIYATIFIASIIVAVVIVYLYKVISDSSRSVYSSKEHPAIYDVQPHYLKDKATIKGMPDFPHKETHATPRHMAKTHPAMPTETIAWGWKGDGKQSRQQPGKGTGDVRGSHCSLYDMPTGGTAVNRNQASGWPYREEKSEAAGKVYKVKRRVVSKERDSKELNKPWGW